MAGAERPYYLVDAVTLDSNGAGTLELPVGASEEFKGKKLFFYASAGTFRITRIENRGGVPFTNADTTNYIHSDLFLTTLSQRTYIGEFTIDINIPANDAIKITLASGTASAVIFVIIQGTMRTL